MATILHAVIGYIFLTIVIRVLTRRPGAQMTLAEFVLVFLIGGVIILSTVGDDRSVTNCTCGVITIALMHRLTSALKVRYPAFGMWVDGTTLVLVRGGECNEEALKQTNVAKEDIMASARLNGLRRLEEIEYAVLERNGGISVLAKKDDA